MAGRVRARRVRLRGWVKWLPFVILPFAVLSVEAYIRMGRIKSDYEINLLNNELDRVVNSLSELKTRRATYSNLDFLDAKAEELGLGRPTPTQIETVSGSGTAAQTLPDLDLGLPMLDETEDAGADDGE